MDGLEEANEIFRKDRVAAFMCLKRCLGSELNYLNAGVKVGDASALYKNIHVQFAKASEKKLREAYNKFSRSEMKQKPNWDVRFEECCNEDQGAWRSRTHYGSAA